MATQFITNDELEKMASVAEEYKLMIDAMLDKEDNGETEYISLETIKARFLKC